MTTIEDQLRDALRELADDVPSGTVPPLRLPPGRTRPGGASQGGGPRRLPPSRWLAPLAAAASVLAIAAGVAAVADHGRQPGGPPLGAAAAAPGTVPPYYVALTESSSPRDGRRYSAGIYETSTGALVTSVAAPGPDRTFVGVSAAADDLTFAVAAEDYPAGGRPAMKFYLVRFDPADRTARLSGLATPRVPAGASFDAFALSPNARRLAVAFEPHGNAPGLTGEIRILNISTGAVRTWVSSQGAVAGNTADSSSLSWADDNATLAFNWHGSRRSDPGGFVATTGVRLLDTAKPGGDLVAGSFLAVRLYRVRGHPDPSGLVPDVAMLTPDGRTVVAAVRSRSSAAAGFAEFSAATGRLLRMLDWRTAVAAAPAGQAEVLWSSRSGRTLVVYSPPGHPGQIAIVGRTRVRLLPSPGRVPFPAAAW